MKSHVLNITKFLNNAVWMVVLFDCHDNEDEMSHLKIPNNSDLPTEKIFRKKRKAQKIFQRRTNHK